MQLKYHQATYDLLTQNRIDPKKAIQRSQQHLMSYSDDKMREEIIAFREKYALPWTRLNLYKHPVQVSADNTQKLDDLEKRYNVTLPSSVREWYSLDIGPDMLSISDMALPILELQPLSEQGNDETERDDLWYFMQHEYIDQGGESIVFKIDVDDPPVYAEYGGEFIELAPTFSTFLYIHFWDWYSEYVFEYGFSLLHHPALEIFQVPTRYHIPFSHLRNHYKELKGSREIRFYDDKTYIRVLTHTIWEEGKGSSVIEKDEMVSAVFHTMHAEDLYRLIETIWGSDAPVFEIRSPVNDESEVVLENLRRTQLLSVLRNAQDWLKAGELGQQLGSLRAWLSGPMRQHIKQLIALGEIETHPDNREDEPLEQRYRLKRSSY
jgi:hypothetical protein